MTASEIHRFIWQYVIDNYELGEHEDPFIDLVKQEAIGTLLDEGKITQEAYDLLRLHNDCVLCTIHGCCGECPLQWCNDDDSLFAMAMNGDKGAMEDIRDVVVSASRMYQVNKEVLEKCN